jgi:hypothetical protein
MTALVLIASILAASLAAAARRRPVPAPAKAARR